MVSLGGGGMRVARRVEAVYNGLVDLMAHFHAVLDYPDEDIDPFRASELAAALAALLLLFGWTHAGAFGHEERLAPIATVENAAIEDGGYLLNIHEGPINFRWKEGKTPSQTFEKNMVITDEPGLYIKNSHGIRIENELLVTEADHNEYGQFMKFEVLTLVPIDLDALLPEQMTFEEREQLNNYHQLVYKKISPYLPEAEKEWLKHYTRAV